MATLQYTVFETAGATADGPVLNENVITIGGSSDQSPTVIDPNTAANRTRRVRITVDANCWVTWGADPTALTDGTDGRMMGTDVSTAEYFSIPAGLKISVIQRA